MAKKEVQLFYGQKGICPNFFLFKPRLDPNGLDFLLEMSWIKNHRSKYRKNSRP
jgi:hypothetical protein